MIYPKLNSTDLLDLNTGSSSTTEQYILNPLIIVEWSGLSSSSSCIYLDEDEKSVNGLRQCTVYMITLYRHMISNQHGTILGIAKIEKTINRVTDEWLDKLCPIMYSINDSNKLWDMINQLIQNRNYLEWNCKV